MSEGIVFANLLLTMTQRLIVIRRIDNKDTPHLTIAFENASGEIDLHFKHESPLNDKSSTYTPILKFPKASLTNFLENYSESFKREFINLLLRSAKKIRPGWLAKNGYLIVWQDPEVIKSAIYASAPKRKGKYRVDSEKLKSLFTNIDPAKFTLFYPSVLHTHEMHNHSEHIYAVRTRGKRQMIPLIYAPWKTGRSWLTFNQLPREAHKLFEMITPLHLRKQANDIWYKVYDGLKLNEIGFARD